VTFSSTPSATSANPTLAELRRILRQDLHACRQSTLRLLNTITEKEFRQQADPAFSPVGWHLGHIAFTESLWLLEHLKEDPCAYPQYQILFAADGLPKNEREHLPDVSTILAFMADIRDRVLTYLETAPLYDQLRLWRWILQHESQHAETATYMLMLHRRPQTNPNTAPSALASLASEQAFEPLIRANMVLIPAGQISLGSEQLDALDNERPCHTVQTGAYWIDCTPVTVEAYQKFMAAGGYHNSQWWHPDGWAWVQHYHVSQPLYWPHTADQPQAPVCGVSWYEADAYACFVGKRLPTEAEWERAARWNPQNNTLQPLPWGDTAVTIDHGNFGGHQGGVTPVGQFPAGRSATGCDDLLGNVWEWTNTWFEGYPGFLPYPYRGYSQTYFDKAHRVLRGGSWATRPWVLRPTFRNWYHPNVQQVFAGFRCVLTA
jgi:iron(II)-dependent oxidoreductase